MSVKPLAQTPRVMSVADMLALKGWPSEGRRAWEPGTPSQVPPSPVRGISAANPDVWRSRPLCPPEKVILQTSPEGPRPATRAPGPCTSVGPCPVHFVWALSPLPAVEKSISRVLTSGTGYST